TTAWLDRQYDGLLVSPISPDNLNPALVKATQAGIPIINVDELISEDSARSAGIDIATRIASNNYQVGQLVGQYVLDHVPANSKVAVLEGLAGNASGQGRHD